MGIGNDIKPKKVYRYKQPKHHDPSNLHDPEETKKEKEEDLERQHDSQNERHDGEKVEELEDDFFHDYNKKAPKKVKKEEGNSDSFLFRNLSAKNITWLFVIALLVIVIYQNFDSIKGIIFGDDIASTNSNTNDEYYEGVLTNRNTNSTNTNANSNTNANANTNSSASTTTVDKTAITLKVLNGNGVAGSADEVTALLKAAGFSPAKSGNARKFTYPESIVYYKTGEKEAANLVKAALPDLSTTLTNSDSIVGTYDVIVVVGKK